MIEQIKTMILDYQESMPDPGVARTLEIQSVQGKATICIGVRRAGKSVYMRQVIEKLLLSGVDIQNVLHLNCFDDRLHELQRTGLDLINQAYFSLYPEKKDVEKVYYFIDEIQDVPGWEKFIERLLRTEKVEIYLTGSSASLLSKEIATQMRGRALSWEIFPFSFEEFLRFKEIENTKAIASKQKLKLQKAYKDYWVIGGFPEVLGLDEKLRIKVHQEYFGTLLFRDVIERHDVLHPKAVSDLAYWLVNNVAGSYSINALTGYLKSLGHKISKSVISSYLVWFEDAYFFFTVKRFDASVKRAEVNPKKVYCIDHAMVNSTSSGILLNEAHLLENLVFIGLRRHYSEIYYYKTQNAREIDFVVQSRKSTCQLIQVCVSLIDEKTRKREFTALIEGMNELGLSEGFIITQSEEERVTIGDKRIHILPAWRFLLTLQASGG